MQQTTCMLVLIAGCAATAALGAAFAVLGVLGFIVAVAVDIFTFRARHAASIVWTPAENVQTYILTDGSNHSLPLITAHYSGVSSQVARTVL